MVSRPVRNFGRVRETVDIPDLVAIQKKSYSDFLQVKAGSAKRKYHGLEMLFQDIYYVRWAGRNKNTVDPSPLHESFRIR